MWGTSSPDDKLTGDLGNVIEATQIGGRRSDRLMAGKLSPGNFGLLQQYRPKADMDLLPVVCTENLILIDYVTESPNVNGDDRAALLVPDPVRLAVQVEEPT
jgi:hypothetical protein